MQFKLSLLLAAFAMAVFALTVSAQDCQFGTTPLVGNLDYPSNNPIDLIGISGDTWFAESFVTNADDNAPFSVSSVFMRLGTQTGAGVVEIWTDNGATNNRPAALLATVGSIASPVTVDNVEVVATESIQLDAGTTYWVVMRAVTGTLEWTVSSAVGESDGAGTVVGHYAFTSNAGTTWSANNDVPSFFQVNRCLFASEVDIDETPTPTAAPTPDTDSNSPSLPPTGPLSPAPTDPDNNNDDSDSAAFRATSLLSFLF